MLLVSVLNHIMPYLTCKHSEDSWYFCVSLSIHSNGWNEQQDFTGCTYQKKKEKDVTGCAHLLYISFVIPRYVMSLASLVPWSGLFGCLFSFLLTLFLSYFLGMSP